MWYEFWSRVAPLSSIALAALILFSTCGPRPAAAAEVGEVIEVRAVCAEQHMVEAQVDLVYRDGGYRRANALFARYQAEGLCFRLPQPMTAKVTTVGVKREDFFVDSDGDTIHMQAYEVGNAWTAVISILKSN